MQKFFLLILLVLVSALAMGTNAPPVRADPVYTSFLGTAINGYDPVAYFKDGKPVEGDSAHKLEWQGATWHFKNAENKAAFAQSPETYAPQFGGYCA